MDIIEWRINFNKDGVKIFKNIESPIDKKYKETEVDKIGYNDLNKLKNINTVIKKIEPEIENGILKSLSIFASEFEQLPEPAERGPEIITGTEQILVIGEEKKVWRAHKDILALVTHWLYENNRLQKKDIPMYDASQGKRYLLNVLPRHAYGRDFDAVEKIDEGIYLHTSYSSSDSIRNANYLMGKFAKDIEFKILGIR